MIKKLHFALLLILLPIISMASPELVKTFHAGKLYQDNKINIVDVRGNYFQMGDQYGTLLRKQIHFLFQDYILHQLAKQKNQLDYLMQQLAPALWRDYTPQQRQLILGVAKGSKLSREAIIILDNAFLLGAILPQSYDACSFVSVWGPFTRDGKLLVARNLDWMPTFEKYRKLVTVVVYHPSIKDTHAVATVVMPGMVNGVTAFNDAGLFISVNDGANSAGHRFYINRKLYLNQMLSFLFHSGDFETLAQEVKTTRANFAMIIAIADAKQAMIYEDAPFAIRARRAKSAGLLIATNDYLLSGWPKIYSTDHVMSKIRYRHLYRQAMRLRGKFDVTQLQQLMDKPLIKKDGSMGPGVTEYRIGMHEATMTLYQVIANPNARELWLRIPNETNWLRLTLF